MEDLSPTDLKSILHSKRANIYYLQHWAASAPFDAPTTAIRLESIPDCINDSLL